MFYDECMLQPCEQAWRATARLQDRREKKARAKTIQVECIGSMHNNFVNYGMSLTIVWQGSVQVTARQ